MGGTLLAELAFSTVWWRLTTTFWESRLEQWSRPGPPSRPRCRMCSLCPTDLVDRLECRQWCRDRRRERLAILPVLLDSATSSTKSSFLTILACADGSDPSTCGYAVFQNSYTMNQLIMTYDACPRVVQYGVDSAASFLRLHDDVPRAVPVSAPALQSSTLHGRCSVEPLAGPTFQSVTLTAMKVFQQDAAGPIDLGNQLNAAFMIMLSPLTSNNPTNPIWDFDLFMEPTVFLLANTYYLEATLDLTFENTGTLTRKLQIPLTRKMLARRGNAVLRRALSKSGGARDLVAVSGRAEDNSNSNQQEEGVFSNIFALRASEEEEVAEQPEQNGSNTAMIAGIAGGIAGLVVVAAFIVVVVVLKKRRRTRDRSASDAPLTAPNTELSDIQIL